MKWYSKFLQIYGKSLQDINPQTLADIRHQIAGLQSQRPLVTVSIIAYNEEKHLLACLWSLSEMRCKYPIEIIGVNNDSQDRTEEIFQLTEVPYYNEYNHSCGYARRCGLNHARGKYHINIDADTMYPPEYVETMVGMLRKKNVVAVSSLWSYIPDKHHSGLALKLYELSRDIYLFLQSFKRPELSVRGLVFAYRTGLAQNIGIRVEIIRGEDGSLALELKKYGKIVFVRNSKARALTGYGTVGMDGSLTNSFKVRFLKGIKNIRTLFTPQKVYQDEKSNLINRKQK